MCDAGGKLAQTAELLLLGDERGLLLAAHQGGDLVITASVPGVDPADIKATIDDGVLAIRADMPDAPAATESKPETEYAESEYLRRERRTGSFSRAIQLPDTVDPEKVTSKYANGVLTVTLPKSEATKVREITVKVA